MAILTIWIIGAILAAILAKNKNRSIAGWVASSILLTPLVVLILLALPTLAESDKDKKGWICPSCNKLLYKGVLICTSCHQIKPPDTKKCPFCAEIIKSEAIVCRYCGKELSKDG